MIEKWYTAYQEILHVPCLISSPLVNSTEDVRHINALTSHIDILPTVLGLAGYDAQARENLSQYLLGKKVFDLPGADLSPLIMDAGAGSGQVIEPDGQPREGILFVTSDDITAPLRDEYGDYTYQYFLENVEQIRELIKLHQEDPDVPAEGAPEFLPQRLYPGSVAQPNNVQCVRTIDWKLVRYWDLTGIEKDEWELYDLATDRREKVNLVTWQDGKPVLNQAGLAHPKARDVLPELQKLLNKKLTQAGYPDRFLIPESSFGLQALNA